MNYFNILQQLEEQGRLRGCIVGGYITREVAQPRIFTTEVIDPDGKFVEVRVIFISDRGKRLISKGNIVAYVPKDTKEKDFHELKGNLSLGGLDYSRMVTMMNFSKTSERVNDKVVWRVSSVKVFDIDLMKLTNDVHDELMNYVESPLSYSNPNLDHVLTPISEESTSSKVIFDTKGYGFNHYRRTPSVKDKAIFEEENNYLIDDEYEVIREALCFPVLAVNLTAFRQDKMLLEYFKWLVDDNITVIGSKQEIEQNDGSFYLLLTDKDEGEFPYIELRRGVLDTWVL